MKDSINKFKQMREFVVEVEIPKGKQLTGVIPFEPLVNTQRGRFRIHATSYTEAQQLITEYLNR
jgi:hypothetical protein